MNKPKPVARKPILDYQDVINFIEEKYNIDTRDYEGLFGSQDKESHFNKYQRITGDKMPVGYPDYSGDKSAPDKGIRIWRNGKKVSGTKEEYDADFVLIHAQYQRYLKWCETNPENKPPEYLDYWHWMIENQFHDVENPCERYWSLQDILEDEESPDWVKDITQKVRDEFSEHLDESGGFEVYISW
jgi:hypothetical protein